MSRVTIRGPSLEEIIKDCNEHIKHQLEGRTYRASNEMRNAALMVLRGRRGGRIYGVPGKKTHYTASAPGEPPAVRTGNFRNSWQPDPHCSSATGSYKARIRTDISTDNGRFSLGDILENGTPGGQMAPRPHHDRILDKAEPKVYRIYAEPYFKD